MQENHEIRLSRHERKKKNRMLTLLFHHTIAQISIKISMYKNERVPPVCGYEAGDTKARRVEKLRWEERGECGVLVERGEREERRECVSTIRRHSLAKIALIIWMESPKKEKRRESGDAKKGGRDWGVEDC
jgi:hypothetical protein